MSSWWFPEGGRLHLWGARDTTREIPFASRWPRARCSGKRNNFGNGSGAVTFADGLLFYRYEDDKVALIEANAKEYVLKGVFESPRGPAWAARAGRIRWCWMASFICGTTTCCFASTWRARRSRGTKNL